MRAYSRLPVLVMGVLMGAAALAAPPGFASAAPPSSQPAAETSAVLKDLVGTWNGPLQVPGRALTFVMRLKLDAGGTLSGTLAVPEQGGTELQMSDVAYANGRLSFNVPAVQGQFSAEYRDDAFAGRWWQGTPPQPPEGVPAVLKRGEFVAQAHALNLSPQAFAALSGTWQGTLEATTPDGGQLSLPVVLRFERNEHAQMVGFLDSPAQNVTRIPVTEVTFDSGKLLVKVGGLGVQYEAQLAGTALTGTWTQGPGSLPLTLTRK
ncbi:MAG TPA: hypothetical protein VMB48_11255 [Steroidobacteraceae bacterium]|nr:hypothetical protein [Steroidobacteraceae bacterium]